MSRNSVFYSFHFGKDVMRAAQVRNIGALEGNEPVTTNEWEEVKRKGTASIERWIDDNMKYRKCVVVLIGEETASRPWVLYEIQKAWTDKRGLMGIYIHNLKDPRHGTSNKGSNPFDAVKDANGTLLSRYVNVYDPAYNDAYNDIARNIERWVDNAIAAKRA